MYRNVIVGVDGEQGGRDAAALAAELASPGAHVTLTHVRITSSLPSPVSSSDLDLATDASARQMLAPEIGLCGEDAEVTRVKAPSVGAGLEDAAGRSGADLIVVGASRQHGISRLLAGDDARSVLHQTLVTVAIAPPGFAEHPVDFKRIGVACDLSPESEVAMAHAGLLAGERTAAVAPCHVVEPHVYVQGWAVVATPAENSDVQLAAAHKQFPQLDGVEVEHVYGMLGPELCQFSQAVDCLVCGSRHQGSVSRFALGSTSDYLARHAHLPLLVTPSSDTAAVERWRAQRQAALA
jgi:nucleotide-binding universal stress UspA family protein